MQEPIYYAKEAVDMMMRKFAAADLPPKGQFHYHQGVFLSGVYQTYLLCKEEKYIQYIKDWVDAMMDEHGNIYKYDKGQMDDIQPGILLYPLYRIYGEEKYKNALKELLAVMKAYPTNKEGGFWHKEEFADQMWLDGLYMGGPICAEYAKTFDAPEFFDLVTKQVCLMEEKTKDGKTGLFYHAYDSRKEAEWADKETGCSKEFWGRSLGWVPVAILDDLDFLPKEHEGYEELCRIVTELLKAICNYQSEEGRWYQVVDKGGEPGNWLENSCTCLFVAAICKAVQKGILEEEYLENAKKAYAAVIRSLTWQGEDIQIGNICIGTAVGDYAYYCEREKCTNDLHGVGAFLLMCAQLQRIQERK